LAAGRLPVRLADLKRPPEEVYLWGVMPPGPWVAIVGSRGASQAALRLARQTARVLSRLGVTILSGGARGIDTAAHEGALDAGGSTLVVAPVWLDRAYPSENRDLFARVLAGGGGYLTGSTIESQPYGSVFHRRNEILAALSDVVLLGEAGVPSGALSAMRAARSLGRPRYVLPCGLEDERTLGCESELARGARPYFRAAQLTALLEPQTFDNPLWWETLARLQADRRERQDVRSRGREAREQLLRGRKTADATSEPMPAGAAPRATAATQEPVLMALAAGATTADRVCEQTGLPASVVQYQLLCFTLQGRVRQDERGLLQLTGA
jgi:DNA processing protein